MNENEPTTVAVDDVVELASETMKGDLLAALLDEFKAARDVWPKLSQIDQDNIIGRFDRRIGTAIVDAVKMIAADGRDTITAVLEQATVKDGIKAVLTLPRTDKQRHDLLDAVGKPVLLVVVDVAQYGGGERPRPDPDQPPLPGVGESVDVALGDGTVATVTREDAAPDPMTDPEAANP